MIPLQGVKARTQGRLLRIRPEFAGLKRGPLLVSLGHIYRGTSQDLQRKDIPQSPNARGMEAKPVRFELEQSYPNPFNPATTLRYQLPAPGMVRLALFDVLGREVAVIVNEVKPTGVHTAQWNASGYSSGIYMARLTVAGEAGATLFASTRKLVLTR